MLEIGSLGGVVTTGRGDDVEACIGDSSGCPEDTIWTSIVTGCMEHYLYMQVDNSRTAGTAVDFGS